MTNKNYTEFSKLLDGEFSGIKLKLEPRLEQSGQVGPGIIADIEEGTLGRIFEVEFDGATCIARELKLKLKGNASKNASMKHYLLNCRDLRHPNIIQFFGIAQHKPNNQPLQVMEKMDCSLTSLIERSPDMQTPIKLSIMCDVASGLKFLHCRIPPVVHCYLSSSNVLLTAYGHQWKAKISDVGLAQMVKSLKSTIFMAPEIDPHKSKPSKSQSLDNPEPSADVFSYGGIMLHIITTQWPEESVISSMWEKKKDCINKLNILIASCLDEEFRYRPQITAVLTEIKASITSSIVAEAKQELEQIHNVVIEQQEEKHKLDKIPIKGNKATQQKNLLSDESNGKDNVEQNLSEISSQQGQPEMQRQTNYELASNDNANDQHEKDSIKDVISAQHLSSRDCQHIQDSSKKNEDDDSVVEEQSEIVSSQKYKLHKNDEKSKCIIENKLQEEKPLLQKDVKSSNEITTERNLEQVDVIPAKRDEVSNDLSIQGKSKSGRSQQGLNKKMYKDQGVFQAVHQTNEAACQNVSRDLTRKSNWKDVDRDQLLVQRDVQVDSKKNKGRGSKKPKEKDQLASNASKGGDCTFDQLGPKVVGFYNEGNTCFFNAMLQCIHQTVYLHNAIAESIAESKKEYTMVTSKDVLFIKVTKKPGQLTIGMQRLFHEISKQTRPISPRHLLLLIGERYSRFGHGTQEDSHEVLRCLMSILREEEIECINQEIRSHCGIKEDFLTDKSVDGEKRLYVKECLSKVSKGVCDIDRIFGCHLISTTICHECEDPLQTTEFHIDLSLPMPEAKSQAKDSNHSETQSKSSKKRNRKNNRSKKSNTGYTATPIQAHTCSLKKSTKIPEVVSCQQKLNSHLEERKLFHCNYSNANDLKLKTDLEQCLLAFTSIDTLDEDNKFICQTCSNGKPEVELCCVTKQILIHELSPVLILHIKRFKVGYHVTKDDRSLSFPFQLDMAPFCTTKCIETFGDKDNKIMYSLYAVVEHNGSLHGGHYKAYVKRRPLRKTKDSQSIIRSFGEHTDVTAKRKCSHNTTEEGEWYCTDDSHVSKRNLNSVQHCKPFLLFYEIQNHGGPGLPKDSREGELSIATQLQEAQPDQIVEDCRQLQFTPHDRRHQDSSGQQREQEQNNCVNRVYSYFDRQRHNNTDSETSNDHQQISKLQEDCERQRNIKQQADNSQLDTNSLAKISPKMHNENQQSNDNLLLQDNHIYCSQLADGDNCTEIKTIDAHPHNMHEEYPRKQDQQNKPSQKSNLINQQMQQIDGSSCTKIKALNVHKETDITEEN